MSETVKFINDFFKNALKSDVDIIKDKILLTERQEQIFEMYYIKKKNVNYIADTLFVCPMVINKELKTIREKIIKILHTLDTKTI